MNVAIIGCGGIAHSHAKAYINQGCKIVGLMDASRPVAEKFSQDYGGLPVFDTVDELLDVSSPDAISIYAPPVAHEQIAVSAMNRGIDVLCEKPMAMDIASAHNMMAAAESTGALLMPAFRHRFLPAIIRMKEMLESGLIGDCVFFNNMFCGPAFEMEKKWFTKKSIAGGGSMLDSSSHSVDIFRFIVGEIAGQCSMMDRHFKTTDVEDAAVLIVKALNGTLGAIESAFVVGNGFAFVEIVVHKGRAYYDYNYPDGIRYKTSSDQDWVVESVRASDGFEEEISHFLGAVRGEHKLGCTAEDGVRTIEVISSQY